MSPPEDSQDRIDRLRRIEAKIDAIGEQTKGMSRAVETNTTDITWLKWGVRGLYAAAATLFVSIIVVMF